MNNNNNIGWLFFGGYKNILPSMLTILPSSSTRAILLTSLVIYSCIPLKAIQYYIIIDEKVSLLNPKSINSYSCIKCDISVKSQDLHIIQIMNGYEFDRQYMYHRTNEKHNFVICNISNLHWCSINTTISWLINTRCNYNI